MKSNHVQTGSEGEGKACQFLIGKNYKIVERNFRTRDGELDIIAYDKEILVFVEVKTDSTNQAGYATEWVGTKKIRKIQKMAQIFCQKQSVADLEMRFDVVTVNLTVNPVAIEHLENAFIPNSNGYY